jgi:hypothetical protein
MANTYEDGRFLLPNDFRNSGEFNQALIIESLNKLKDAGIGRASTYIDPINGEVLKAYSLPLYEDEKQHITIFADGEIYITESRSKFEADEIGYRNFFSPQNVNFRFDVPDLERIKAVFRFGSVTHSKVIMQECLREKPEEIRDLILQAIRVGIKLKEERERIRTISTGAVIDAVNEVFPDVTSGISKLN